MQFITLYFLVLSSYPVWVTHSSILAWKVPQTEEPGKLQSMGHKESDMTD